MPTSRAPRAERLPTTYHLPRRPEETLFHRTLSAHWPAFKRRTGEHGGLPEFVLREVDDYLACGLYTSTAASWLAHTRCGHEQLVALSCEHGGGHCPSRSGRRMADSAAHLVTAVLPEVTIRRGARACTGHVHRVPDPQSRRPRLHGCYVWQPREPVPAAEGTSVRGMGRRARRLDVGWRTGGDRHIARFGVALLR